MMKFSLLVLIFLWGLYLNAQDFYEWSAGGETTALTFQHQAADEAGIVAVGETSQLNSIRTLPRFLQSDDEESFLKAYELNQKSQLVLFFDPDGKLIRKLILNPSYEKVHGILIYDHQQIIMLVEIETIEYSQNDEPMGYLPAFTNRDLQPAGFNLVFLTRKGDFMKSIPTNHISSSELEIFNFAKHPNGSLILAGGADPGKLVTNKDAEVYDGGGDFVMMLDTNGTVEWIDVISYRENICCSRMGQNTSLSISPNGTIYFGGSYRTGGIFSNGLHTLVPTKYQKKNNNNYEVYIVSYQKNGTINWVKAYGAQSILFTLYSTQSGVFASHKTQNAIAFGKKVDTTQAKFTGLSFIDEDGKLLWTQMTRSVKVHHITEKNNQVVLLQTIDPIHINEKVKIGDVELPERTRIVLSTIDQNQKLTILKSAKYEFESRNHPIIFTSDLKGNIYLGGNIFCSLPFELKNYDTSLPAVECYGSTPVLGKVKLK